jgi:hypothetical protein
VDNNAGKQAGYFSKKLKAGKRRTYFFDVRSTKQGDFFLTITESKKKFDGEGYESHKIYLYKEDFKKFMEAMNESVDYIKTELMPDFDYDAERPNNKPSNNNHYSEIDSTDNHQSEQETDIPSNEPTTSANHISDDDLDWK